VNLHTPNLYFHPTTIPHCWLRGCGLGGRHEFQRVNWWAHCMDRLRVVPSKTMSERLGDFLDESGLANVGARGNIKSQLDLGLVPDEPSYRCERFTIATGLYGRSLM
jgi:hypothetical protein